jgi:hypothetical protein
MKETRMHQRLVLHISPEFRCELRRANVSRMRENKQKRFSPIEKLVALLGGNAVCEQERANGVCCRTEWNLLSDQWSPAELISLRPYSGLSEQPIQFSHDADSRRNAATARITESSPGTLTKSSPVESNRVWRHMNRIYFSRVESNLTHCGWWQMKRIESSRVESSLTAYEPNRIDFSRVESNLTHCGCRQMNRIDFSRIESILTQCGIANSNDSTIFILRHGIVSEQTFN